MDTTAADPLVGTLLDGRYRVGGRIARGGMATVYEAVDVRLDRQVAVKVLHSGYADDPDFALRFQREARAAARLAHPNVVGVFDQGRHDSGQSASTLFLVMEYVPGCTLRELMREQAPLPPARALALLEPILSALGAAHAAGFVHRDVKPENVLLTDDGRVKVADFGLARAVATSDQTTATSGVLIGTVSYLAPELVVDGTADPRTDVYACGVLLYEMLTGAKPHQGDSPIQVAYKHVHTDVAPPSHQVADIPPYLDALVARATSRRRESRLADASVMLRQVRRVRHALDHGESDDLELTRDLTPTTAVSSQPPQNRHDIEPRVRRPARSRKGLLALLVVLLLGAGAAAGGWYYGIGRYRETPELVGMTMREAHARLGDDAVELSGHRRYSETVPAGEIISTDPAAGERVLDDGTIAVVVSKGKERYDMPKVAGLSKQDAADTLTDRNLAVGDVTRRFSERVDKGKVIRASKQPGAKLRRDTEVDLVVSKGRRPIDVPDLVGDPARKAVSALEDAGLTAAVTKRFDDEVPEGQVISQSPEDGTLFKDDAVELVVSKGPQMIEVPSVFGQDEASATATLEAAGFDVEVQKADAYVGFNRIAAQDPSSGDLAPKGSTVTIYLY
ncbi:MAG TPA: Stk1 family PASTA domain-containing Ser/Thr kinase [Nocardioidaceae bacterium]|nr:Stk1 family PASTA domain-containing Ser/Thr kinase [Nocardioidaceae bacterium]